MDPWCRARLGSGAETLFVVAHLSEVVGARLADGREVVVKRRVDEGGRAQHCVAAQRLLAEQGFPCPLPLTAAIVEDGFAVHAERLVAGGEPEADDTPEAARRSAVLLADLACRLAVLELEPPLPNPEWVRWESPPERQRVAELPAWLDELDRRVRAKLAGCALPHIVGHADWEAQNMRWEGDTPLAVYDWDSLAWLPEAALAGTAAGVFATHGEPTLAPVESSATFLDAYEERRGSFSADEREVAWAASLWVGLHNARDELIFDRPRLSYERLEEQRDERLRRAAA